MNHNCISYVLKYNAIALRLLSQIINKRCTIINILKFNHC